MYNDKRVQFVGPALLRKEVVMELAFVVALFAVETDGLAGGLEPLNLMIEREFLVVPVSVKVDIRAACIRLVQLVQIRLQPAVRIKQNPTFKMD